MTLDIRILGPLEVERDGDVLELGGRRQRAVLAVLVLHAHQAMSPERLADAVWDGGPPASADTTLRGYVSNLRKVLEPDRAAGHEPRILRTTPAGYVLDVADEAIDARRFERLVAAGRDADDLPVAVEAWGEALALWRGEALQDFAYEGFAQPETTRLTELRLACVEDLLEARIELGHHDAVTGELESFCAANPDRERALRLWMLALYRCGRQSEALRIYEEGRKRLADELGVDPSPELRALHEQIVRQDRGIAAPDPFPQPPVRQTLTFLLGDVERSTSRLRDLDQDYPAVLEEHRRVLKETLRSEGGRDVRTYGGDEVFAAFDVATDAVRAAVAAQLALCGAGFDEDRALPVRMGIHTGEATYVDGEFVGLPVHLASRIMDAAHGGQVLASQATKQLVASEEDIGFTDQGRHVLKDFPDNVRLFQVTHPELRGSFPQLRTRAVRTHNLPNRLKSFIGRDDDVGQIERALDGARVVTLTGVGGVGKTSLAMEAGRRLGPRYADGVWLCELASMAREDDIVGDLAATLGVQQQPGRSVRESLLGAFSMRESLLILDNCEHLLDPVAELVEDIVQTGPSTDVLTTSREALGVDGERSFPVRSLVAEDADTGALRLFEDRARDVRPDFTVDEANLDDVTDICRRLDGIPLAIELAATRITAMSPAQIAKRLEEGFHFLRSGRRAAVDRHRTLQGAIAWQYEMLSEAERNLFDRLSVFAGGFTHEMAEEVCGRDLDLDVADGLASLVAKSMVTADVTGDEARYALLETLRQYGQDRLVERGEADHVLERHARHFLCWSEEMWGEFEPAGLSEMRLVTKEWENLRAAHAWSVSSGEVDLALRLAGAVGWLAMGSLRPESLAWAGAAAAMPGAASHPSYPTALALVSFDLTVRGDRERAAALAEEALALIDDADDPRRLLPVASVGIIHLYEGRLDEARTAREEGSRVARANGLERFETYWLGGSILALSYAGDHATAIARAEECVERARGWGPPVEPMSLYYLGEALAEEGSDLDRAMQALERCIEIWRASEMSEAAGTALVSTATLHAKRGEYAEALTILKEVVDQWRLIGNWQHQWTTIRNVVEILAQVGSDEDAAVLLAATESSATAAPTFGPQGERLAALATDLEDRMGTTFAGASGRGKAMSDPDAVAHAKTAIDRALDRARAEVWPSTVEDPRRT